MPYTTRHPRTRGFTLIELMIVVVIIGLLASIAIYGVFRYLASSKTSEAREFLGRIAKDAVVVFEGEGMTGQVMQIGSTRGSARKVCASATPIPSTTTMVSAKKYQSSPAEWLTGDHASGWSCLRSQLTQPQAFQYAYEASGTLHPAEEGALLSASAFGDLDGDSSLSTFWMAGRVQSSGTDLVLTLSPAIGEATPEE